MTMDFSNPMTIPPAAVIALRDLIAKWRDRVTVCRRLQAADKMPLVAQAWTLEADIMERCADELDALTDEAPHD